MIEITKLELIKRTCHCGVTFRCLETSPQKYHALSCTPLDERAFDWRSRKQKGLPATKTLRTVSRDGAWTTEEIIGATSAPASTIENEDEIRSIERSADLNQRKDDEESDLRPSNALSTEKLTEDGEIDLELQIPRNIENPKVTVVTTTLETETESELLTKDGQKGLRQIPRNYENIKKDLGDTMNSIENEGQFDIESGLSRIEQEFDCSVIATEADTETRLERTKILPTIKNTHQLRSQTHSTRLLEVSYQSQNLVDESIGQLKELMKLSVSSLYAQDAKTRDPQMINAAVNSAKAITSLLKIKLEAAQLK